MSASEEPVIGLLRDDGNKPERLSLFPLCGGEPLVYDVTVVDPLAKCHDHSQAEQATVNKIALYSSDIFIMDIYYRR